MLLCYSHGANPFTYAVLFTWLIILEVCIIVPILQMRLRFREMEACSVPLRTEARIWTEFESIWLETLGSYSSSGVITSSFSKSVLPGVVLEDFAMLVT